MLYLTLQDDPFPDQEHDENALLELVRAVARRDGDDRTISELIRFQDALERLGLLWTPLDALDKYQAQELVRNLHLELTAPGDMVYLKHSPAMRSYVVLRGVILLTSNVLDREGLEGVRALGPGEEFGHPLDPDLDLDKPVADFLEYAKAPHLDVLCDGGGDVAALAAVRGGSRKDGRAELLVVGRQDWIATLQTCSNQFSRILKKVSASKDPDPLKDEARVAFNYPAKGRVGEHLGIATKYLRERVAFCSDLPPEQVLAMAAAVELRGFTVPGRHIFRRGRECYGEAYIMFTGSADQKGSDKSGDRLIKEGDLFGDEHFAVAKMGDLGTPFRTATAMSRTAPCELLVIPARECRRLQAFVAVRNGEKAMAIFEKSFINLPREAISEIALLATFRTIKMHEQLAVAGEEVTAVFFVFRGECAAARSDKRQQKHQIERKQRKANKGRSEVQQQRYGPGHIIGWPYLMANPPAPGCGPTKMTKTSESHEGGVPSIEGVSGRGAKRQQDKPQKGGFEAAKKRRPRRHMQEWQDTVTVTTPAQVLSVPLTTLLSFLSEKAIQGLRTYVSMTHKQKLEETSRNLDDDDDDLDGLGEGNDVMWSSLSTTVEGCRGTSAFGIDESQNRPKEKAKAVVAPGLSDLRRPLTAPQASPKRQSWAPVLELDSRRRPSTTSLTEDVAQMARGDLFGGSRSSRSQPQFRTRTNTPTRWRWRVGLTEAEVPRNRSLVSRETLGSCRQRESSPTLSSVVWGYATGGRERAGLGRGEVGGSGGCCTCPLESCHACSPSKRLERLRSAPVWAPSLPQRNIKKPDTAPATTAAQPNRGGVTKNTCKMSPISPGLRPSTYGTAVTMKTLGQVGSLPSFKLWSREGGGFGIATVNGAFGGASTDAKHPEARGGAASAGRQGATVVAAPVSDFGVTITSVGDDRKLDDGSEVSLPPTSAAVPVPERRPGGRLSYTLVQVSTRAALDPCEPEASLCLRILGSFASEVEAKTRVWNLYHSILPANLAWQPHHGAAGKVDHHVVTSYLDHSDHLFLLRKGVVFGRLSFNVAPKCDQNSDVDRGDPSNNRNNSSQDNRSNNSPTVDSEEDIGRGYDTNIPAVFKAKGQQFAVAFVSSADRVGEEWEHHQDQRLEIKQPGGWPTETQSGTRISDVEGTEGVDAGGSSLRSRSFPSSVGTSPQVEGSGEPAGGSGVIGVVQTVETNDNGRLATGISDLEDRVSVREGRGVSFDSQNGEAAVAVEVDGGNSGLDAANRGAAANHGGKGGIGGVHEKSRDATEIAETVEETSEGIKGRGNGNHDAHGADTISFSGRPSRTSVINVGSGDANDEGSRRPLLVDELLDGSDTESSDGLGGGGRRRRNWQQGAGAPGDSAHDADDTSDIRNGDDEGLDEKAQESRGALSWIISRMGFLEEVEGCYATAAKAFRKAIEILEGKETALAATRLLGGPISARPREEGRADEDKSARQSPLSEQQQVHPPRRRDLDPSNEMRVACILPLYEWFSLGDGLEGVFAAIGSRSIADPSEAARAGVDPLVLWTEQRARRLRTNLYNLLRAAGPREIRSRCGVAFTDGGEKGSRATKPWRHAGHEESAVLALDEGVVGQRMRRILVRKKAAMEAVRSARASVLRQNEKLVQAEANARRRFINAVATETATGIAHSLQRQQQPKARRSGEEAHGPEGSSTGAAWLTETPSMADDLGSIGGAGTRLGRGGSRGDRSVGDQAATGKRGLRHELRAQMNIERKRARLFEDIQTLPYLGARRSTKHTKVGTKSGAGDRSKRGDDVKQTDQTRQERTGTSPPAITFRAPKVQEQKRLHGKPPSSFFSRVHVASPALAIASGATTTPEEAHLSAPPCSEAAAAAAAVKVAVGVTQGSPTMQEQVVVAGVPAKPQSTPSATRLEPDDGLASAASNMSACTSTLGSSVSTLNGEQEVPGGGSCSERPAHSNESSSGNENGASLSETVHGAYNPTGRGGKYVRAGGRGSGLKVARTRGGDGWSTSRVPEGICSLDEELVLLDGILHDRKIRTWVETTLAPSKKHHHHHHHRNHA